jgi:hypothetical protein
VPYELVFGDLEGATYSSVRAGLVKFRRRIEQLRIPWKARTFRA